MASAAEQSLKQLIDEGCPVHPEDVAVLSLYLTSHSKRFGAYVLSDTEPPTRDAILSWQFPMTTPTSGNAWAVGASETK